MDRQSVPVAHPFRGEGFPCHAGISIVASALGVRDVRSVIHLRVQILMPEGLSYRRTNGDLGLIIYAAFPEVGWILAGYRSFAPRPA